MMDAIVMPIEVDDVGNNGERMIVANIWPYWAHLAVYHFAIPFARGRRVLDAGAGEGYGAAYLARHGAAEVRALEFSAEAVGHAKRCYADLPVQYEQADLNHPLPLADHSVDLVFSSNVFEHIGRVDVLAAETARVVKHDGVVVVAVPPITSAAALEADMRNQFHVHHIPPSAWEAKLLRFFSEVRCHGQFGRGIFASKERERQEMALPPDQVTIRETDFEFPERAAQSLDQDVNAICAIFVCRNAREVTLPETIAERTPAEWREGEVAARLIAAERMAAQDLRKQLAALMERLAATPASASADTDASTEAAGLPRSRGGADGGEMHLTTTPSDFDVGNDGERMIVANLWSYWAHLSIYRFALPFAAGLEVLDAGSGEGYGAAYLVRGGATKVIALDAGIEAVAHARRRYASDRLRYDVADLNRPLPLADRSVDLVFSSNVFEHVGHVDLLAAEVARVVRQDGVVVVAVPPITSVAALEADMDNQFHVHHLPPAAWHAKLSRFFTEVQCHAHNGSGAFADRARHLAEVGLPPDQVTIRETDFDFPAVTPDALNGDLETVTAIFVCRGPRATPGAESLAERSPAAWCEGAVAARCIAAARKHSSDATARPQPAAVQALPLPGAPVDPETFAQALQRADAAEARVAALSARLTALEESTIWRSTGALRSLLNTVRRRHG